jgi:uncharacterized protein
MKILLISILIGVLLISSAYAQEITGFVNDNAHILGNEKQQIEQIAQQLYDANLAQIAIITINSLEGQPIEDLALNLAEGNLGTEDRDNGLLVLIAVEDRSYRFEVGRGLEPIFNDAKVGRYGRDLLIPAFQQEKYGEGVLLVMNEFSKELTGKEIENIPVKEDSVTLSTSTQIKIILFIVVLLGIVLFFMIKYAVTKKLLLPRNKRQRDDRYFLAALVASNMMRKGGGFSGGFGGFGGGSFGGGGASGRW